MTSFELSSLASHLGELPDVISARLNTLEAAVDLSWDVDAQLLFADARVAHLCGALGLERTHIVVMSSVSDSDATLAGECHDDQQIVVRDGVRVFVGRRADFETEAERRNRLLAIEAERRNRLLAIETQELEEQRKILDRARERLRRGDAYLGLAALSTLKEPHLNLRAEVEALTKELKHQAVATAIESAQEALRHGKAQRALDALSHIESDEQYLDNKIKTLRTKAHRLAVRQAAKELARLQRMIDRLPQRDRAAVAHLLDLYRRNMILTAQLYGHRVNDPLVVVLNEVRRRFREARIAGCRTERMTTAVAMGVAQLQMEVVLALTLVRQLGQDANRAAQTLNSTESKDEDTQTRLRYSLFETQAAFRDAVALFETEYGSRYFYLEKHCLWPEDECIPRDMPLSPTNGHERQRLVEMACFK